MTICALQGVAADAHEARGVSRAPFRPPGGNGLCLPQFHGGDFGVRRQSALPAEAQRRRERRRRFRARSTVANSRIPLARAKAVSRSPSSPGFDAASRLPPQSKCARARAHRLEAAGCVWDRHPPACLPQIWKSIAVPRWFLSSTRMSRPS